MHVGKVGSGWNLQYDDSSISNLLADSVIPDVNMLDALVGDRVASQLDCTLVVFINRDGYSFDSKFKQQLFHKDHLVNAVTQGVIFCFSG